MKSLEQVLVQCVEIKLNRRKKPLENEQLVLTEKVKKLKRAKDVLCKNDSDFGFSSLLHLNADTFHLNKKKYNGKITIARIWYYISTLNDEEQVLAKESFVTALSECIEGNKRKCIPGQIQRILIAVCQGRLDGVNIDNSQTLITTSTAITLFFNNPFNRGLRGQDLDAAVQDWLQDNPFVERAPFELEIKKYAAMN